MPIDDTMTVVSQNQLTPTIYELTLQGSLVQYINDPGQFVHVMIPDDSCVLRRPISITSYNKEKDILRLIYRCVGKGTDILRQLSCGDQLTVFGPLGHGFPLKHKEYALLIGGGVGVPPLYELACQLKAQGTEVTMIMGVSTKDELFYKEQFETIATVHIATDDGTYGFHGHIGELLSTLDVSNYDIVYSCGPAVMLRCVAQHFHDKAEVYTSLEERMACGIGACYGCVVKKKDGTGQLKVCSDGPVFLASEVEL